jgi:hypothetical protein
VSANSRRLLAVVAFTTVWLAPITDALAGDGFGPNVPPAPNDCHVVYEGTGAGQGKIIEIHGQATIDCDRVGNTSPYGAGSAHSSSDTVPDGAPCYVVFYAPVTFQNLPTYIRATWKSPMGPSGSANVDPNSYGNVVSATGVTAATNDVFALFRQNGTYQNQQCQAGGFWFDYCQLGAPAPNPDPCILAQPHLILPADSPAPPVAPYVASVVRDIKAQAGNLHSMPSPNGLVNLPTCFWIDDIGVPDERDFTLVLPGPPDPSNRRIYYTYLIRVFFAGVDWSFDDPFGNDRTQPHPACGQRPQLTAHSYQMISEKHNSDGYYHVTATEKYQVTVDLYWDDSYGPHHSAIDPGVQLPITVSPPGPYNQFVGQVEAIPIGR